MFFRLPPEIRNIIYHMLVSKESPLFYIQISKIDLIKDTKSPGPTSYKTWTILHVCQEIRQEACPIFFGINFFFFVSYELYDFLADFACSNLVHVRKIYISSPCHKMGTFISESDKRKWRAGYVLLDRCVRLTRLEVWLAGCPIKGDLMDHFLEIDILLRLRGLREVSITRGRFGRDNLTEDQSPAAQTVKRLWMSPKPKCGHCEGGAL